MLKISKAKKEDKEKIKQYKRYSKKYLEDSAPIISDQDFDLLKKEILDLEKRFDFKDKDSPSKTLGFTHPKTKQNILFDSEIPNDMISVINKWRSYTKHKNL